MPHSLRGTVLSSVRWTAYTKLVGQLVTWVSSFAVIRILTPADYGLVAMATVVVAFLLTLAEFGLTAALIQRQNKDPRLEREVFSFLCIAAVALLILCVISSTFVAAHFREPRITRLMTLISLQFLTVPFVVVPLSRLSRDMRFKELGVVNIVASITGALCTLLSAYFSAGAYSLVFGMLASNVAKAAMLNAYSPIAARFTLALSRARQLASFSFYVLVERTVWYFYTEFDTFIVGTVLGSQRLGFYSIAKQLAAIPYEKFTELTNAIALPAYATVKNDIERVRANLLRTIKISMTIMIPCFWGLAFVAADLIPLVMGNKWLGAIAPMRWLCISMPLRIFGTLASPALVAINRPDVSLKLVMSSALVVCPAMYFGTRWGVEGVAIAWAASYPLAFVLNTLLCRQYLKLNLRLVASAAAQPLFCGACMIGTLVAATVLTQQVDSRAARLTLDVVLGATAYVGAMRLACNGLFAEMSETAHGLVKSRAS